MTTDCGSARWSRGRSKARRRLWRLRRFLTSLTIRRGLPLAVDEEPRVIAAHFDPDRRPDVGLQVDLRLHAGRRFLTQRGTTASPGGKRMRGMIALLCSLSARPLVGRR